MPEHGGRGASQGTQQPQASFDEAAGATHRALLHSGRHSAHQRAGAPRALEGKGPCTERPASTVFPFLSSDRGAGNDSCGCCHHNSADASLQPGEHMPVLCPERVSVHSSSPRSLLDLK